MKSYGILLWIESVQRRSIFEIYLLLQSDLSSASWSLPRGEAKTDKMHACSQRRKNNDEIGFLRRPMARSFFRRATHPALSSSGRRFRQAGKDCLEADGKGLCENCGRKEGNEREQISIFTPGWGDNRRPGKRVRVSLPAVDLPSLASTVARFPPAPRAKMPTGECAGECVRVHGRRTPSSASSFRREPRAASGHNPRGSRAESVQLRDGDPHHPHVVPANKPRETAVDLSGRADGAAVGGDAETCPAGGGCGHFADSVVCDWEFCA